ncbi:helix-turn-helix domain-containing protein [Bradyrhizobium sp. dw_78]|uniref:helix-turn-helix transcriptional regulator n=1 Tax=Bradyrhizobium sp. dw_78 TaxID=2719793 RepID=UPI001BD4F397|nr:helix-turn-helix domain-containing protein [Bradyrhizobium sp. dw_78]
MSDKPVHPQQRYLRTPEAARFLGLSGRTLEKHRTHGTGPRYRKLGGRVVYAVEDLLAWADIGLRRSTTEQTNGVVHAAKPVPGFGSLARGRRP